MVHTNWPFMHAGRNVAVDWQHLNSWPAVPQPPRGMQQTEPAPGGPWQSTSLKYPLPGPHAPTPVQVPPTFWQSASPANGEPPEPPEPPFPPPPPAPPPP